MSKKENPALASGGPTNDFAPDVTDSPGASQALELDHDHLAELRASAISDDVIASCGVYTAHEREDLPEPLRWVADRPDTLPALVFPMEEAGRGETWQVKPQPGSIVSGDGRPLKYICPKKGSGDVVPSFIGRRAITDDTRRVLIVEGTKQALAVMSCSGDETAVFGIPGIQSWMGGEDGPNPAFAQLKALPVYIVPDADAARNRAVYDAALQLGEHVRAWGASPVRFVRIPGHGSQGVDDVLATVDEASRAEMLDLWVKQAQDKPARRRPPVARAEPDAVVVSNHPRVSADASPTVLWDRVGSAVHDACAGHSLFRQDGQLVHLYTVDDRRALAPVSPAGLTDMAAQAIDIVHETERAVRVMTLSALDTQVLLSAPRVAEYPLIEGLVEAPVLAPSGRIVCEPGYDEETHVYVDLAPELEGFSVPDAPSQEDVEDAVELLKEPFVDFPFKTEADRVRAIGALLTLCVRPAVPTVPMHVLSANAPGSGKGLILSVLSRTVSGRDIALQKMPTHDDEMQKVLTASLLAGRTVLALDEVGDGIDSRALAALLTSSTHEDRVLGESRSVSLRNTVSVFATGQNVAVRGDLGRRTMLIELESPVANPEARTDFKNPNLESWVQEHRRELLEAVFTLIRSWVGAGRPAPAAGAPIGSFEDWYHIVGGVLEHAGVSGLMDGVAEQRARHNESELEDLAHLAWLSDVMGDKSFRAFDVACAIADASGYVPLPADITGLDEATPRRLGRVYSRLQDRVLGSYKIVSAGMTHHVKKFRVLCDNGSGSGPGGGTPPPPDPVPPSPPEDESANGGTNVGALVFDLETGSADDLHTADDPSWIRLAAYSIDGAEPVTTTNIDGELLPLLKCADRIVGHNIVQYDLPALKRLYGLDTDSLVEAGKVHDTLVMARLEHPPLGNQQYSLGAVAERFGVDGKLLSEGESVLKHLAAQHGGFGNIPADHADYIKYAKQDVRATAAVYQRLLPATLQVVSEEYLGREHLKMQRIAAVESHGLRVNTPLVDSMLSDEETIREDTVDWLSGEVGVPAGGAAPWSTTDGKSAIADYIARHGGEVLRTDKGRISISANALQAVSAARPDVPELKELAERMTVLLQSSSPAATVKKYLRDDRVYPSIQSRQATGRLSTTRPGMTVFGSRSDRLIAQRALILPDNDDQLLIAADLSQIDARCMAAGAGDKNYAALFAEGRDSHTEMAVRVFGDASRRSDAKALAHATNYGMGPRAFASHAGKSVTEAEQMMAKMQAEFPVLEDFKARLRKTAEATGYVTTGFGRRVRVSRDKAYTQAPAAYGQGTARDAFLEGVLALPQDIVAMIRIFVHDEIVLSVPRDRAEEIKQTVMDAFCSVQLPCSGGVDVPVLADSAGPAETWAGCK